MTPWLPRRPVPCEHVDLLLKSKLDKVRELRAQFDAPEAKPNGLIERSRTFNQADGGEGDVCRIFNDSGSHTTHR